MASLDLWGVGGGFSSCARSPGVARLRGPSRAARRDHGGATWRRRPAASRRPRRRVTIRQGAGRRTNTHTDTQTHTRARARQVTEYLKEHDTAGLDIQVPARAAGCAAAPVLPENMLENTALVADRCGCAKISRPGCGTGSTTPPPPPRPPLPSLPPPPPPLSTLRSVSASISGTRRPTARARVCSSRVLV